MDGLLELASYYGHLQNCLGCWWAAVIGLIVEVVEWLVMGSWEIW